MTRELSSSTLGLVLRKVPQREELQRGLLFLLLLVVCLFVIPNEKYIAAFRTL